MKQGKHILGKPVISVSSGSRIGTVDDLYLGSSLERVAALYMGTEGGLFNRTARMIPFERVVRLGEDTILVEADDVIQDEKQMAQVSLWTRLSKLQGRQVDTTGGTRIGAVDDVLIGEEGKVLGFSLGRIEVKGPIAQKQAVAIDTITDLGQEDETMTIDLERAERQELTLG